MKYYTKNAISILQTKLIQSWLLQIPSHYSNMHPFFSEHFLTFWNQNIFESLCISSYLSPKSVILHRPCFLLIVNIIYRQKYGWPVDT